MTAERATIRVVVVDDQPLIRHSLRLVLDSAPDVVTVGEAADGAAALEVCRRERPDVVLMDVQMRGVDGIEATRRICTDPLLVGTRVLVLSMFDLDEHVRAALEAGASGFLLKDAEPETLLDAVRRTAEGSSLFAPAILARLVSHFVDAAPRSVRSDGRLTARETEVLALVGGGLSNDEIGARLHISRGTTKSHIGNLLAKLGARDRAQLVIAAYERALVRTGER